MSLKNAGAMGFEHSQEECGLQICSYIFQKRGGYGLRAFPGRIWIADMLQDLLKKRKLQ